jgi:hypothetical protein
MRHGEENRIRRRARSRDPRLPRRLRARARRIYVHESATEEIRWCYYKNGRFVVRPPDIPEEDLLRLFEAAVAEGVFTPRFRQRLKQIL